MIVCSFVVEAPVVVKKKKNEKKKRVLAVMLDFERVAVINSNMREEASCGTLNQ